MFFPLGDKIIRNDPDTLCISYAMAGKFFFSFLSLHFSIISSKLPKLIFNILDADLDSLLEETALDRGGPLVKKLCKVKSWLGCTE